MDSFADRHLLNRCSSCSSWLVNCFRGTALLIMARVLRKWPQQLDLSVEERYFFSSVIHNAGIYNGIVAAGLFVAASVGPGAFQVQIALLAGGVVAGLFGAATLTKETVVQAFFGAIALIVVVSRVRLAGNSLAVSRWWQGVLT